MANMKMAVSHRGNRPLTRCGITQQLDSSFHKCVAKYVGFVLCQKTSFSIFNNYNNKELNKNIHNGFLALGVSL